jgi:hypothetical protein
MQLPDLEPLVGRPLSEVVTKLFVDEKGFSYADEPPAKLKVLRIDRGGDESLEIHLKYDSAILFDEDRKWPLSKIGAAEVLGFVHHRGNDRRVVGVIHERLSRP